MAATLRDDDLAAIQAITEKDRSNLYLTSQFLGDRERYLAFLAMYAVMRVIDDAVDQVLDKDLLDAAGRDALRASLDDWQRRIEAAYAGEPDDGALDRGLAWAAARFPLPVQHWQRFVAAMRYDVDNPRFADFATFLDYAEGATVAPTTIYVYLLCAEPDGDGCYHVADFDYARCGHELGIFAYLAHVLRDVREDALVGRRGLVYLSLADLAAHGLDDGDLRRFAEAGAAGPGFAPLVAHTVARARAYQARGQALVDAVAPRLAADRRFVLRLIVAYYDALLSAIAAPGTDLFGGARLLDGSAKLQIAQQVADAAGFALPADALLRMARAAATP